MEGFTFLDFIVGLVGIVGGGAGLAALLRSRGENRKLQAEAAEIIQRTAAAMVKQYAEKVEKLERRVGRLERSLREWQKYASVLWDFICRHGLDGADELPCAPADEGGDE